VFNRLARFLEGSINLRLTSHRTVSQDTLSVNRDGDGGKSAGKGKNRFLNVSVGPKLAKLQAPEKSQTPKPKFKAFNRRWTQMNADFLRPRAAFDNSK